MSWFGLARLIAKVGIPVRVAVLTYVGAGGLAGVAVVTVALLTPAGQVVQQAIEPARELVQGVLPTSFPSLLALDPRQELSRSQPVASSPVAEVVAAPASAAVDAMAESAPLVEAGSSVDARPPAAAMPPRSTSRTGAPPPGWNRPSQRPRLATTAPLRPGSRAIHLPPR